MSTPIKPRTVNLSDHGTDPMKAAWKPDLTDTILRRLALLILLRPSGVCVSLVNPSPRAACGEDGESLLPILLLGSGRP